MAGFITIVSSILILLSNVIPWKQSFLRELVHVDSASYQRAMLAMNIYCLIINE